MAIDKKKSILNVFVSILFKIILTLLNVLVRSFLVKTIGNGINGLNSLFLSIVGFMSLADLGFGTAISYCMYKPIVEGNVKKVAGLYRLFKKIYIIISVAIATIGLVICPFLPYLANGYSEIEVNIYISFILMLVSVVISYLFGSRISLINAYKNNYIATLITSLGQILQLALQLVVLFTFKSYYLFLLSRVVGELFIWLVAELHVRKKYRLVALQKEEVDSNTKKEVKKNVQAMFFHKVGGVLVNSIDGIIISTFIGLIALGSYSNYITIMAAMTGIITLFFTPLTSTIGHFCASDDNKQKKNYFYFFYTFNFLLGFVFFLGYFAVIDDLIIILFGQEYVLDVTLKVIIVVNYFIQFMRQSVLLFRDATGTFYHDRFKPLLEGVVNVVLSIALVLYFGIAGVIIATIITNLLICHIVEPFVLFKHGIFETDKSYYFINYFFMSLFAAIVISLSFIELSLSNVWVDLIVKGFVSIFISLICFALVILPFKKIRESFLSIVVKKVLRH